MVLVTGGTGFLGSHLLHQLVKQNVKVRAIFRPNLNMALVEDIKDKIDWVQADVTDIFSLEDAFEGISQVYHCAGIVSFNPSRKVEMFKVNVEGTANVVNLCIDHNIEKFIHVSSIAALGRESNNATISEDDTWSNSKYNTRYALSKYLGEAEAWRGIAEGLNTVIVNPSIILGTGSWNADSSVLFTQVWKGLRIYPKGLSGFVDVEDVATTMIQLMNSDQKNERFIINSENWTYKKLFDSIAAELGTRAPYIPANSFLREVGWRVMAIKNRIWKKGFIISKESILLTSKNFYYKNDKIREIIGFKFIPLIETIRKTSARFLQVHTN